MTSTAQCAPSFSSEFSDLVDSHKERWKHCQGTPEETLLRLTLLRDLVRALHAQKSKCLALGKRDQLHTLKTWENQIEQLRGQSRLEGELTDLIRGAPPTARKRTRLLPEAIYSAIEKEKLDRYDRIWESSLAAEAVSLGWRFWTLEAWVEISLIEEWNRKLIEALWPTGIVLFTESATFEAPRDSREMSQWRGRWFIVLNGKFKHPSEISINPSSWAGTPIHVPQAPQWRLLFSPKLG